MRFSRSVSSKTSSNSKAFTTARSALAGRAFFDGTMSRPFYSLIVSFFLLVWSQSAFAGLKVLEGEHTVVYDIVNPRGVAFIPDYA